VSEGSFNLFSGALDPGPFSERPGRGWRTAKVGERLGGKLLGLSVYELDPGQKTFPFHYHLLREEWVLVLAGSPTLRSADGEQVLGPGDVVVFGAGAVGAHALRNDGEEPARVAIFSNQPPADAAVYPDSRKLGVAGAGERHLVRDEPQLDYWDGED
jgi:uncharacterized cupin superfamily protein